MAAVDFSDPCARFAALRDAYYSVISGSNETLVRYKGPEGEREVRFSAGNVELLRAEMAIAENACNVKNGTANPNRRYAIRAGARRPAAGPEDWWTVGTGIFRP